MPSETKIEDDPAAYGSKGQTWHPVFVNYMVTMVAHQTYHGMPDAVKDDGKIQWEAPSNRSGGQFKDTHHRRREWWKRKAVEIGVDPTTDQWISKVAKRIHPTGEKPCKRCGRIMRIAYAYPNGHLRRRASKVFSDQIQLDPLSPINDLITLVADVFGNQRLSAFHSILTSSDLIPPKSLIDEDDWLSWIEDEYIPNEPSLLSPGVMSNAPDRFDGFHSFNLCCRKKADTGRLDVNMRSYTTDRRVFEFWSDGDWIAADRMMGLISSKLRNEPTADGGDGPASADHIGPLSLGFSHRPQFRLLSKSANSAKNNRMTVDDVRDLILAEDNGEIVASWYAKPLWNLRKNNADSEELCLRLSKQLRDNQRVAMHLLVQVYRAGHLTFLASLLELDHADFKVDFHDLRTKNYIPIYDTLVHTPRTTKYAMEQKARRLRIGFTALKAYGDKENRHTSIVPTVIDEAAKHHLSNAIGFLKENSGATAQLDVELKNALLEIDVKSGDHLLRSLSSKIPHTDEEFSFNLAKAELEKSMTEVGRIISSKWETDRYVRNWVDQDTD